MWQLCIWGPLRHAAICVECLLLQRCQITQVDVMPQRRLIKINCHNTNTLACYCHTVDATTTVWLPMRPFNNCCCHCGRRCRFYANRRCFAAAFLFGRFPQLTLGRTTFMPPHCQLAQVLHGANSISWQCTQQQQQQDWVFIDKARHACQCWAGANCLPLVHPPSLAHSALTCKLVRLLPLPLTCNIKSLAKWNVWVHFVTTAPSSSHYAPPLRSVITATFVTSATLSNSYTGASLLPMNQQWLNWSFPIGGWWFPNWNTLRSSKIMRLETRLWNRIVASCYRF